MDTHAYHDQLSIDTPEQVDLSLPIAGLGSRFLAAFVDVLIQTGVYLAVFTALALLITLTLPHFGDRIDKLSNRAGNWLIAAYVLLNFLFFWGYYTFFEAFWHGQTPGKRVAKLRVVKDSGREITLFESMTRNLLRLIDFVPGFYAVGVVTILLSRENKRLGDLLAGTLVLHQQAGIAERAPHESRTFTAGLQSAFPAMQASPEPHDAFGVVYPTEAIAHLRADDLVVLETFFARVVDLDAATTERLSMQLLTSLCARMHVPPAAAIPTRRSLEAIAWQLRSLGAFR